MRYVVVCLESALAEYISMSDFPVTGACRRFSYQENDTLNTEIDSTVVLPPLKSYKVLFLEKAAARKSFCKYPFLRYPFFPSIWSQISNFDDATFEICHESQNRVTAAGFEPRICYI